MNDPKEGFRRNDDSEDGVFEESRITPRWVGFLREKEALRDPNEIRRELSAALDPYEAGTFLVDFPKGHPFAAFEGARFSGRNALVTAGMTVRTVKAGKQVLKSLGLPYDHIDEWAEQPHFEVEVKTTPLVQPYRGGGVQQWLGFAFRPEGELVGSYFRRQRLDAAGNTFPMPEAKFQLEFGKALLSYVCENFLEHGLRKGAKELEKLEKGGGIGR